MAHNGIATGARPVAVVCHRGASNRAPENTIAAARAAIAQGADYVELDVNLSADGVHYVFHGPRLEKTTNGEGLFHHFPASELDALDAGSWFDARFAGEPIPRLDAMLELLRGQAKVFFDVKRAHLPTLIRMAGQFGLEDCFFWFWRDADAQALRKLAPGLALKVNVCTASDVERAVRELNASLVEVLPRHLSRGVVDVCRAHQVRLMVNYMGEDPAVLEELTRWPIDLINLDHQDRWQAALEQSGSRSTLFSDTAAASQSAVSGEGLTQRQTSRPQPGPPVRRAVLFLLDGCRPDALQQAATPNIDALLRRGSVTWQARTVMPSISLPCHTSLFFSMPPHAHGVVKNEWRRPPAPAQSIGEVIRGAGHDVGMFYTWEELRDLAAPGTVTVGFQHRLSQEGLDAVGKAAAEMIAERKPTFSFVYLEATDAYGHMFGWMSPEYLEAVTYSDALLGQVVDALAAGGDDGETVFVVMADHGGHDHGHGTALPEDMTIPILFAGPGVATGAQIVQAVNIVDVAPTLLHLLGIEAPPAWEGAVIREILV